MRPALAPGDDVTVAWTKWDGGAHWTSTSPVTYLGEDEWGWWYGQAPPNRYVRPGAHFDVLSVQVGCHARDRGHTAAFYLPHPTLRFRVYVDVTTRPALLSPAAPELAAVVPLDGVRPARAVLHAVDLDLDVVEPYGEPPWVDDEDEFEDHIGRYGYPDRLVAAARAEADLLVDELGSGHERFSERLADSWRDRFAALRQPSAGSSSA